MESKLETPNEVESIVGTVLKIAQMHGTALSLADLANLLPQDITVESITQLLESKPLESEWELVDPGFVVRKSERDAAVLQTLIRRSISRENLGVAKWLLSKMRNTSRLTVAVSGSNSYGGATRKDDVDMFCVLPPGEMWTFLTKALIITRISRLFRRSSPPICLSCVMDENYAAESFASDRGRLFARDALTAVVIQGGAEYKGLLESASWISKYFPAYYSVRLSTLPPRGVRKLPSGGFKVLDRILFIVTGGYIKAKAGMHNRLIAKNGSRNSRFRVDIGPDHLVYESEKYIMLRRMYDDIRTVGEGQREKPDSELRMTESSLRGP